MTRAHFTAFDCHTHLDFPSFDPDRAQVCERARQSGVDGWVIAGADPQHWDRVVAVADQTGGIAVLGVHPWWTDDATPAHLESLAGRPLRGVGETGLDYARARTETGRNTQKHWLREVLAIARRRNLPVVLHCVRAWPDLVGILKRDGLPQAGGMVHGWTGDPQATRALIRLGLHVSFGPAVTRPRNHKARRSVREVPARQLLVETDCPDQMGAERRGEPADLWRVIGAVAAAREEPEGDIARTCRDNARRLFGLVH